LSLYFGRECLRVRRQDAPWKVVRAFTVPGSGALLHLNNVSGGVLAGDRLALDVEIEAGAAAQITTTGATRLYRHRAGARESEQRANFLVGDDARLEYLPDALIPYAGSRHFQSTEIRLGRRSMLFWWEVLAPGRLAAGERFAFDALRLRSAVYAGARPVLRDQALLEPAHRDLSSAARMFGYSYMASFYAIQEGQPAALWHKLEDQLNRSAENWSEPKQTVWGASTLASKGVVVRGLAMSGRFVWQALTDFWRTARMEMTGQDAVPPRKIY
jgi:urease accessory protein